MSEPERRRLFVCATGQDTGGWGIHIKDGFERLRPGWHVRSAAASTTYLQYPRDMPWRRGDVWSEYQAADVVHLRNSLQGWQLYDGGEGKPTIVLYHGTAYRAGHEQLSAQARHVGAVELASTVDLTMLEPRVTWVGAPYRLAELEELRATYWREHDTIRIAHAPTNRAVKGTAHFLEVVRRLQQRHPVELVLIEGERWDECLRRKATADVFYDQLELGYGNNAIEAWGMGMPVVAGVADPAVRREMRRRWGRLPFVAAEPDTLEQVLERLVVSARARQEGAQRGMEHFARWHDERVVIPQLEELYLAAPATEPGPTRERKRLEHRATLRAMREERAARSLERALARRDLIRADARAAAGG